jgi:hypothetical protein
MRAIGRALMELLGVLAAGFIGFFVVLVYMAGGLIWFACGGACFGFLLVALFSMVMWLSTHDAHAFHVMLGYFVYAGVAYALVAAMSYYRGKFSDRLSFGRARRAAARRISGLQIARDASFEPVLSPRRRCSRTVPDL